MVCNSTSTLTTNYITDLGNIFVSYADVENLLCETTPIATLTLTNTSTAIASSINFYSTQINTNTYYIQANTIATLVIRSGYYVNLNTSITTTVGTTTPTIVTTTDTIYFPGNYTLMDTNINVSTTTITGIVYINAISVYNNVGQYWNLYPPTTLTPAYTNVTSTSDFFAITGNNYKNENIIIGTTIANVSYANPVVTTSMYSAYSTDLNSLSFNQITIKGVTSLLAGSTTYTISSYLSTIAIAISNNNSTILYPLIVEASDSSTTQKFIIPLICSVSDTTSELTMLYGNDFVNAINATSLTDPFDEYCQIQMNNGQPFCMIAGTASLYVNNGTSGTSITFTAAVDSSGTAITFSGINSISMSQTGQYQLVAADTSYYSNNFGAYFTAISSSVTFSYMQISALSQYAVATSGSDIYISSNYGRDWTVAYSPSGPTIDFITTSISSNGQYIIATNSFVTYYSSDYGSTFTLSSSFMTNASYIFPSKNPIGIACGNNSGAVSTDTLGIQLSI